MQRAGLRQRSEQLDLGARRQRHEDGRSAQRRRPTRVRRKQRSGKHRHSEAQLAPHEGAGHRADSAEQARALHLQHVDRASRRAALRLLVEAARREMADVSVRRGEELLGYLPSRVALLEGDQVRVGLRGACRLPVEADDGRFHLRRHAIHRRRRLVADRCARMICAAIVCALLARSLLGGGSKLGERDAEQIGTWSVCLSVTVCLCLSVSVSHALSLLELWDSERELYLDHQTRPPIVRGATIEQGPPGIHGACEGGGGDFHGAGAARPCAGHRPSFVLTPGSAQPPSPWPTAARPCSPCRPRE